MAELKIRDNMMHISNYTASADELKKAAKLCHDRPLNPPQSRLY